LKKLLLILVTLFIFFAFGNIVYVSSSVLQPSERSKSNRSVHIVANLVKGDYRLETFDRKTAWNEIVLLLRDWDGVLYVFLIPTKNDSVPMPDRFWGWSWQDCMDFRPELDVDQKIKKGGVIKCHDKNITTNNWEWSYNGSPKYWWLPDIYAPPVEIVGDKVFINK